MCIRDRSEEAQLLASDCTVVKFDEASVSSAVLRGSEFCVSLSDGECECRDVYVRIGTLEPDRLMCAAIVNTDTENGKNRLILREMCIRDRDISLCLLKDESVLTFLFVTIYEILFSDIWQQCISYVGDRNFIKKYL